MIPIKTEEEIQVMREGGARLKEVLGFIIENLRPGVTTGQLDKMAEDKILSLGGKPSFKMVPGYHWATCITVNDEVVHGIPGKRVIKEKDIVGIDVGIYYQGFHTDTSWTVEAGSRKSDFLEAGKMALKEAIKEARPGNRIAHISRTIDKIISNAGFTPVRALTGHGVGKKLHEEPVIPCFFDKEMNFEKSPEIRKGMVFAVEVIYNYGSPNVILADDSWTIKTEDGKISGLFEKTVAITVDGPLILTV